MPLDLQDCQIHSLCGLIGEDNFPPGLGGMSNNERDPHIVRFLEACADPIQVTAQIQV
jgi:hypothetical protein